METFGKDSWQLQIDHLNDEDREKEESWLSLNNGYMGMRGTFSEAYSGSDDSGLYLTSIWQKNKPDNQTFLEPSSRYEAAQILDFSKVKLSIDGFEVDLKKAVEAKELEDYKMTLDMKRGSLSYTYIFHGVRISIDRFFSIAKKELAVFAFMFESLDYFTHRIRLTTGISADFPGLDQDFRVLETKGEEKIQMVLETMDGSGDAGSAARVYATANIQGNFQRLSFEETRVSASQTFEGMVDAKHALNLEKRVLVFFNQGRWSSEDMRNVASMTEKQLERQTYFELYDEHVEEWEMRWKRADVKIETQDDHSIFLQQAMRFNLFQALSTYYGQFDSRGIREFGYSGPSSFETSVLDDLFALPFYAGVAPVGVTKSFLQARFDDLKLSKLAAKQHGLSGALYPLKNKQGQENSSSFLEVSEKIYRNALLAASIKYEADYSGDDYFLRERGVMLLIELSRFFAARVTHYENEDAYGFDGVSGFDEYQPRSNNNWLINQLASWCLEYTEQMLVKFDGFDFELGVEESEREQWRNISQKIYRNQNEAGIFLTDERRLKSARIPLNQQSAAQLPLAFNWPFDRLIRSEYLQQSDVFYGLYILDLLSLQRSAELIRANYDYYRSFISHEKVESHAITSLIAFNIGEDQEGLKHFEELIYWPFEDKMAEVEFGLNVPVMPAAWLTVVKGIAQMKIENEVLRLSPKLPAGWSSYQFCLSYRGRLVKFDIADEVRITLLSGEGFKIQLYDQEYEIKKGE